ncbi:hypothetical protein OPV22_031481 [Ensete ventricosum]|uniref:Uncharacterized protein n=1 Tax=Ensete ventricosum TaxID=4639 RepID=A0AAV8PMG1_ENSVE|nr:hypothetical protein OPV22_031481 [Ensete ventricosum]
MRRDCRQVKRNNSGQIPVNRTQPTDRRSIAVAGGVPSAGPKVNPTSPLPPPQTATARMLLSSLDNRPCVAYSAALDWKARCLVPGCRPRRREGKG